MDKGIHMQKQLAMGQTPPELQGSMGVEQLSAHKHAKSHPDNGSKAQSATLRDHKRSARHPIPNGKSANQANPDHGMPDYL